MDLTKFQAVTFDCYGTLINWERGILDALRPVLATHDVRAGDEELLSLYAELEHAAQDGEYRSYRQVLRAVMAGFREHYGIELNAEELDALALSVGRWEPFPDTAASLRALHRHYRIVIATNIDNDLFALTRPKLGVELDGVITAEFVHSYKPAPRHFKAALALLDLTPDKVLHVAESRYHDIAPAKSLGFATVWVRRAASAVGASASEGRIERELSTPTGDTLTEYDLTPDLEVADLATLARLVQNAGWR